MLTRKCLGLLCVALIMLTVMPLTVFAADEIVKESPMLTALVEAGELEPLKDRLPITPKLIDGFAPSQYAYADTPSFGGMIRIGTTQENTSGDFNNALHEFICTSPGLLGEEYHPSVFLSFEPKQISEEPR